VKSIAVRNAFNFFMPEFDLVMSMNGKSIVSIRRGMCKNAQFIAPPSGNEGEGRQIVKYSIKIVRPDIARRWACL
jgi:hypothetical protein